MKNLNFMKKLKLFSVIFSLIAGVGIAQKPIYTKAKVTSVKVYRNSAELHNTVSFNIPSGVSEVVVTNISEHINEKTLQIGLNVRNISVLSSQFTKDYSSDFKMDTSNPQIKKVNDSIKIVENLITKNKIETDANKKAIELLDKNQTVLVNSQSSTVTQLAQLTEFYTNKRIELDNKLVNLNKKSDDLSKLLSRLKNSLKTKEQKEAEEFASGAVVLKLMSNSPTNIKMNLSYIADEATWKPYYEIKSNKISEPLSVNFKAIITQDTGLDWKGVKLSLINGYSYRNNTAPSLSPWFIYGHDTKQELQTQKRMSAIKKEDAYSDLSISNAKLEEVVVTGAGFSISANQLNTSYEVDVPYDILSNDEEHLISLYQQNIPAEYQYFTVPNYRKEAYLLAKIKNFNNYHLVSAPASIIFEGMYIGETNISPNQTEESMDITLGNDPKISIKRENIQDKSGEKFLSSYREKTVTYDIVIKNNKKEGINIEVKDRIPLSNNDAIKVEILEDNRAKIDKEKGYLTWNVKISPAETKKIRVSYKVRYPKDFIISNF